MTQRLLQSVSTWKVEAKFEDVPRYFFRGDEYDRIMTGDYSLVIGRKGTGKTAIAEYISRASSNNYASKKLSFKNFPFNELYSLQDDRFTHPNQYITIWKYVILSFVCRMIGENPKTDPLVARQLEQIFGNNADTNLSSLIKRWTIGKLNLSFFGTGGTIEKAETAGHRDWIRSVEQLESIIVKYSGGSRYFVVLDELDEDFKDVIGRYKNDQYLQLITGLIKAVSEIRSISVSNSLNICPVIFLRDDIFDLIRDNDKNKLVDVTLQLLWDETKIKSMLAFRIWRSNEDDVKSATFGDAWSALFLRERTKFGFQQKKTMTTFDFIARSTHLRPRDFIRYLQLAASHELKSNLEKIDSATLRHVDASFSPYLRNELVDEIESVLPEINEVFDVLSYLNKQRFSVAQFKEAFNEMSPTKTSAIDADTCLRLLFHFSVIGNSGQGNSPLEFFKYRFPQRKLNLGLPLIIHRGLYKALEIV
ncbi:P-loop ATPase, Sll1717 family [Rhizobium ruizarguesonis]